ncbi:MAG: hypothetical protein WBP72_09915 [Rhodocyclaceae bacterium]
MSAPAAVAAANPSPWWGNWKVMVPLRLLIGIVIWLGFHFDIDDRVIPGGVFVFGLLLNAYAWMLSIVAMVPIIGPLITKALSIGFIWLLNAIGYLVALIAIKRGYLKDVLTYRGLTIALIVGIVIGYVLGRLF